MIAGYCPMGCGETLFAGEGGHVTCSRIECPDPCAVDTILSDRETDHIATLEEDTFSLKHPLRERVNDELLDCALYQHIKSLPGPPLPRLARPQRVDLGAALMSDQGPGAGPPAEATYQLVIENALGAVENLPGRHDGATEYLVKEWQPFARSVLDAARAVREFQPLGDGLFGFQGGTVVLVGLGCSGCGNGFWTENDARNRPALKPGERHPCPHCGEESAVPA